MSDVRCFLLNGVLCDIASHPFHILYADVDVLLSLLRDYRLFWVLDFIYDTAEDLLRDHSSVLTMREQRVCTYITKKDAIKRMKARSRDIQALRRFTAMMLYEILKPCRKLTTEDKLIVIENFNLNRIEK